MRSIHEMVSGVHEVEVCGREMNIAGNPASEIIVIAEIANERGMKSEELKAMVFPQRKVKPTCSYPLFLIFLKHWD